MPDIDEESAINKPLGFEGLWNMTASWNMPDPAAYSVYYVRINLFLNASHANENTEL